MRMNCSAVTTSARLALPGVALGDAGAGTGRFVVPGATPGAAPGAVWGIVWAAAKPSGVAIRMTARRVAVRILASPHRATSAALEREKPPAAPRVPLRL